MGSERKGKRRINTPDVLLWAVVLLLSRGHAIAGDQWRLIPVEIDGEKNTIVADFAIGSDGIPWVALARPEHTICYWHNDRWHKLAGGFTVLGHGPQFIVAPTGEVYLIQERAPDKLRSDRSPNRAWFGSVHLLEDKRAEYVTDFYRTPPGYRVNLLFDHRQRIWNWGDTFLAKFEDGQWERVEADVGPYAQVIEDPAGNVYCFGKTLSCYRDGRFTTNAPSPFHLWEQQEPLKGYLWGTDRALFLTPAKPGVMVVDLNTLQRSDVLHADPLTESAARSLHSAMHRGNAEAAQNVPLLLRTSLWDAFRDGQGNIWALGNSPTLWDYVYFQICAADNRVMERPETVDIDWGDGMGSDRKAVLCAKDGTIFIGGERSGVYLLRDGVLTHMDWKRGLAINEAQWVHEHPDGTIWFASRRTGVAVYDPHGTPGDGPPSVFQTSWQEYPLAVARMVRDFKGNLWCCLKSEPCKVSRWDGHAWEHFDLGFETTGATTLAVDNLNRLHILAFTERAVTACRLADGNARRFADFREMLVDSVATGSREFKGGHPDISSIPIVTHNGQIWCRDPMNSQLMRHVDGSWQDFHIEMHRKGVFTQKGQVMVRTETGFLTPDRGQLVAVADDNARNGKYLLGESGLRPFDQDLYAGRPEEFFPACKTTDALYVFDDWASFRRFQENDVPTRAVKFPKYFDRLWLAPGGFWAHSDNLCAFQRYYQGLLLTVDLALTPVASSLHASQCDVYEDSNNGLWIHRSGVLFHITRPTLDTQITSPQVAECASPALRVEFAGISDGPVAEPLTYAWRLDGGSWSEPTERTYANLEFTEPGSHEFEVLSIGAMGNLDTTPAVMDLSVTLPVPEVRIVSAPQEIVMDLDVAITCEVVKQTEGTTLTFQWRLDGGDWLDTQERTLRPSRLEDGEHTVEVRAMADGKYVQAPPASVKFEIRTDHERLITSAILQLHSDDSEQREAAVRRLTFLGRRCLPALKKELERADENTRWWIQATIEQIEN